MNNQYKHIIHQGESETVEYKTSFSDEVIISLVAFANTKGGTVYIGISDQGIVKGVDIGKETVQNWVNEIKVKTQPSIIPDVEIFEEKGKQVVCIQINEFPIKPVSFKGRYFKRIGNANHQLSVSEVADMHLKTINSSWDFHWKSDKSIADVSLDKVEKTIKIINRRNPLRSIASVPEFLTKERLINDQQITNACYLMFRKEEVSDTCIQMGLFASETVIKDDVSTSNDIITQVDEVMDFIIKHINKEIIIAEQAENIQRWQYPLEGIRELVVNMIVHRDYTKANHATIKIFKDCIIFFNQGTLPNTITLEQLLSNDYISSPRNMQISSIFKEMGLIERYGTGIKRVKALFLDYQLPEPEFKLLQGGFWVKVKAEVTEGIEDKVKVGEKEVEKQNVTENVTENVTKNVTERSIQILDLMRETPSITTEQIAKKLNVTKRTIIRDVEKLRKSNRIEHIGSAKSGNWRVH